MKDGWIIKNGEVVEIKATNNREKLFDFIEPPVYEVIRIINGTPLFFDEHIMRLQNSVLLVNKSFDYQSKDIYIQIQRLINLNELKDINVRIEYGLTINGMELFVFIAPTYYPDESFYLNGVDTITANVVRENPHAKVVKSSYIKKISELRESNGVFEIILENSDGKISEGSKSNLFFIKDKIVYSAREEDILIGITRLELMKIIKNLDYSYVERDIYHNELSEFDACFISGTSIGVLPIKTINEIKYNSSDNHVIINLREAYESMVSQNLYDARRIYND